MDSYLESTNFQPRTLNQGALRKYKCNKSNKNLNAKVLKAYMKLYNKFPSPFLIMFKN